MSQYYFLISSLPFLLPDTRSELTIEGFLADCASNMTPAEFALVKNCRLDPAAETGEEGEGVSHPLLDKWKSWETSLRNELVRLRASALKADAEAWIREGGDEAGLFESAREAVNLSDPGEAEVRLDRLRWSFLDEMEAGHFFDLEKLMIYHLKLQILKRQESFTSDKGDMAYKKVYEAVVEQIQA